MSGRPTLGRPLKTTRPSECESKLLSKGAGSGPPEEPPTERNQMQPYQGRTRNKAKPTRFVGGAGSYDKRGSKPKAKK